MRSAPPPITAAGIPDADETDWPLQSQLELGAYPTAVPCARLHSRLVAGEWGLTGMAEVVELIVSELTTNAVQATDAAGLTGTRSLNLWLRSDGRRVVVQVWDGSPHSPVRQEGRPDAESGRGLLLVESLSAGWGSHRSADGSGKVVWALVDAGLPA
ncbi:MAG TPA: ATP-binding protein [Streptosporangiaceae bacterium]|nr:ATP-binding protein [Streptosporangiaceae bacterium]